MNHREAPIGIFDSGVGGLTVTREVYDILPGENVVYFGDVGRYPYGGRSKDIIAQFTQQDIAFLEEHRVKYIICACNTVSAVALEEIKARHKIPMIGVIEPGAIAATKATKNGRIGVIGTHATISSNAYAKAVETINPALKVFSLACPLFVPLAEEGYIDKEATRLIARDYLSTMKDVTVDTLILGCTHYPLLQDVISQTMGDSVTLIDSGQETARVAKSVLEKGQLLRLDGSKHGEHKYFVSDVPEKFSQVATRFLGRLVDNITRVDISRY